MNIQKIASQCKNAAIFMSALSGDIKNNALQNIIKALESDTDQIINTNKSDLMRTQKDHLEVPLIQRLKFDRIELSEVCDGMESLIKLEDPVGKTLRAMELDRGLTLFKVSRPIGVIGVIFESRPDALVQIAGLCLKSGNAVLLKGGSEASATNQILATIISRTGVDAGLPQGWLGLLETRKADSKGCHF